MTAALHIHQLNKHFANGKHALRDINLTVQRGEMVALIGASGSGKSTLLRHVAGLVVADASSDSLIEVDGRCVELGWSETPACPRWALCSSSSTWWTACRC